MPRRTSVAWVATLCVVGLSFAHVAARQVDVATQQDSQQDSQQGGGRGGGRGQAARDAQAQMPSGTAMILGQVITGDSGSPVRRARVSLSGQGVRGQRSTLTDDEGRFVFTQLAEGRYSLTASKAGFVAISYGAKAPGRAGTPIQLSDGQKLESKPIVLPKGGVVTGIVLDEYGEPAPGTPVRAMKQVIRTGEKRLENAGTDTTDDRGMYRIYGLQPGQYVVYAQPRNQGLGNLTTVAAEIEAAMQQVTESLGGGTGRGGRGQGALLGNFGGGRGVQALQDLQNQLAPDSQTAVAYAPVFFPGTTSPSGATNVEVTAGLERLGVDFQLRLTQTAQVSGMVQFPDGTSPGGTQITLVPKDSLPGLPGNTMNARAGQDGTFNFRNVIPGQYTVTARAQIRTPDPNADSQEVVVQGRGGRGGRGRGGPPSEVLWALADVYVDGQDQSGLSLQLQPGMTVSGRVAFDGQQLSPPTDLTRIRINLTPVGAQDAEFGNPPPATVDASGQFTIKGVPPGRYSLRGSAPSGNGGPGVGRGGAPQTGNSGSWVLASSVAGGRDTLDFPLTVEPNADVNDAVITFADRSTQLTGTLQDASGLATSEFSIIVFPSDKRYWQPQSRRIQSVRPGTDGQFSVRNLPAGDYMMVAVTDVEPGEWYDPDFLDELSTVAMRFSLRDGEQKTQDIRLSIGGGH